MKVWSNGTLTEKFQFPLTTTDSLTFPDYSTYPSSTVEVEGTRYFLPPTSITATGTVFGGAGWDFGSQIFDEHRDRSGLGFPYKCDGDAPETLDCGPGGTYFTYGGFESTEPTIGDGAGTSVIVSPDGSAFGGRAHFDGFFPDEDEEESVLGEIGLHAAVDFIGATAFDGNNYLLSPWPGDKVPGGDDVLFEDFTPTAINNNGWAIDANDNSYWDAVKDKGNDEDGNPKPSVSQLDGPPIAINDSNDILVGGDNNPLGGNSLCLIEKGNEQTKRYFFGKLYDPGLLPPKAQIHLRSIYPYLMSNRAPASADGSVGPVLYILFSAEIHRTPASEAWAWATFLLRLLSDGTTDLQEVAFPEGVTDLQLKSINTSGIIAGIGNGAHALLLAPVYVTVDSNHNKEVDIWGSQEENPEPRTDSANRAAPAISPALDAEDKRVSYVKFGLWNEAFDPSGNLRNGNAELDNFVGCDGRRFYISLPTLNKQGSMKVHWYTESDNQGDNTVTLTPSASHPEISSSKALMLVSDIVDNVPVNTGLPSGGDAASGMADHRLRKAKIGDHVYISYDFGSFSLPVFDPAKGSPNCVKRLNVQVVNTRSAATSVQAAQERQAYIDRAIDVIKERLAIAGVDVSVSYNASEDTLVIPTGGDDGVNLFGVNVATFNDTTIGSIVSRDEQIILNAMQDRYKAKPPGTVYLIVVGNFSVATVNGESYPPSDAFTPSVPKGAIYHSFVKSSATSNMTPVHEICHQLLSRIPADSVTLTDSQHYGMDTNSHYVGAQERFNLMKAFGTIGVGNISDSKRLWNDKDHYDGMHSGSLASPKSPFQIDYLRLSPILY